MKLLNIAILSKMASPTVTIDLIPALKNRGHNAVIIDLSVVPIINFDTHPLVKLLLDFDIVYYRTGLTPHTVAYLELLLKDSPSKKINLHYSKHPFAHDKTYEINVAHIGGILVPKTISDATQNYFFATEMLGTPFIIKPNIGTQGDGVELIHSEAELNAYIIKAKNTKIHIQEYIPHDSEYRVHTLGGEIIAMYKRIPAAGEFKSNISLGAELHPVETDLVEKLTVLATKTARLFDFEILAIDFMKHSQTGEFYFTEVNLNPGWHGWNAYDIQSTGVDITTVTVDYFERIALNANAYDLSTN